MIPELRNEMYYMINQDTDNSVNLQRSTSIPKHNLEVLHAIRISFASKRLLHYRCFAFLYLQDATLYSLGYLGRV